MLADDLPEGWTSARIGDCVQPKIKKGAPAADVPFTYIDISSIDNDEKRIVEPKRLSGEAPSRARQHVQRGDILVSMTRPNLNAVAQVDQELDGAIASTGFDVLRGTSVMPEWLFAIVTSSGFVSEMTELVQGALYPAVKSADVRSYEIPVPPLPEQRRIVARLDAIETHRRAAREKLDQLPNLLDRYRQSVLAAAFRGDLTAAWREAHPDTEPADSAVRSLYRQRWIANRAQTLTERAETRDAKKGKVWTDATCSRRFKTETAKAEKSFALPDPVQAEDHHALPEGWVWMTLEEMVDPARGLCYGVVQPGKDPGEGVPLIRVQDLLGEHIDRGALRRIEPAIDDQYERSRVEPGDVLVSLVGTIGRVATVDAEVGYANIARAVGRVSALCGLGEWIALCLQAPQIHDWLQRESREVARKTLNLGTLAQAAIPVPPLAEAAQAVSQATVYLQRGRAIMATAQAATERVESLRQSTLARAFRGGLVPTDAALARLGGPPAPAASGQGRGEAQTALDLP